MILAAALCAEGRGPAPRELKLAWQAQMWGALPDPGGLRDQRAGDLERMAAALNTYLAVKSWKRADDWVAWSRRYPDDWAIVQYVLELRGR